MAVASQLARAPSAPESHRRQRRGLQLALLAIAGMAAVSARAALAPLLESVKASLGLTDNQLALLLGPAFTIVMLVAAVPLGLVIDRYRRARLMLALLALLTLGSILTAIADSFVELFVARGLVGFAILAFFPTAASLVADLYEPAQRGRASMVMMVCQFAASSGAFAASGYLFASSDWGPDAWRWSILCLTVPVVVVTFLLLALEEPIRTGQGIANPTTRQAFQELWLFRGLLLLLLMGKVMALIALQSIIAWAAPFLARGYSLQPDRVGAIMAIAIPLGGIIGTIAGGFLADLCQKSGGPRRTVAMTSIFAAVAMPLCLFVAAPNAQVAGVMLGAAFTALTTVAVMVAIVVIVAIPNEIRGVSVGILTAIGSFVSVGLAPLLVSWLSGAIGGPMMIGKALTIVCVASSFLSAAIFGLGGRYLLRTSTP
jgi:predicted MFS family arabinose efflux permease